jgi:hypothetical protein
VLTQGVLCVCVTQTEEGRVRVALTQGGSNETDQEVITKP